MLFLLPEVLCPSLVILLYFQNEVWLCISISLELLLPELLFPSLWLLLVVPAELG